LDESAKKMTLPVLKKIKALVNAGAKIAGIKPEGSPTLNDNEPEFQAIVNEIWRKNPAAETQNYVEILKASGVQEDVIIKNENEKILYVHRKTANEDIYWLDNRVKIPIVPRSVFRISGKEP
jgi:hypothetical protein